MRSLGLLFATTFLLGITLLSCESENENLPAYVPPSNEAQKDVVDVRTLMAPKLEVGEKKYFKYRGTTGQGPDDIAYILFEQISDSVQRYTIFNRDLYPSMTVDTYFGKELMTMTSLYSYYVYAGEWQNVTAKIKGASKYKQKVGDLTPQQMTWQYDSDPGDTSSMQSIRRFEGFAQSFSFEGKAYRSVTFLANEQMAHYDNGKEIYQKAYEARYRYAHNLGIVQFDYLREGDQKGTYYLDKIIPDSLIQQEYDEEHAN